MRYIRTKEGIFDLFRYDYSSGANEYIWLADRKNKCDYHIKKEDVIKQADTIEELCDEFVCDYKNGPKVMQNKDVPVKTPISKEAVDYFKRNNQVFYGAIWTDKGLIYVAKMNEKGEWELI